MPETFPNADITDLLRAAEDEVIALEQTIKECEDAIVVARERVRLGTPPPAAPPATVSAPPSPATPEPAAEDPAVEVAEAEGLPPVAEPVPAPANAAEVATPESVPPPATPADAPPVADSSA